MQHTDHCALFATLAARARRFISKPGPRVGLIGAAARLIPQLDGAQTRAMGRCAQQDHRGRVQCEVLAFDQCQPDPALGKRGTELAVREQRYRALRRAQARDEPVGPGADLGGRFAARAPITPDVPIGMRLADVCRAQTFVVAAIPFSEVGFDLARRAKALDSSSPRAVSARSASCC
jgi:hypothetical protein